MKSIITSHVKSLLVLTVALGIASTALAEPKKLLVVTVTKGFRHSSIPTAEKILAQLADRSEALTLDFVRDSEGDQDDKELKEKTTLENLKKYDGVIFANTTGDLPLADPEGFLEWLRQGKAFIGMHSATDTFHGYPPFIDMIGGEFRTHGAQVEINAINQDPDHPACKHLTPVWTIYDEIYIFKNFHRNRVHGLLTLDRHPNEKTPGDYPVAWCKPFGEGRVFYTSLGHREDVWENPVYQQHIIGGIKWALGLADAEIELGFRPLFNAFDLEGWKLRNADGHNSWKVVDGNLINDPGDQHGTDLVSQEKFKDFEIRYAYKIPEGSNSGVYLRGRYEIQILDDYNSQRLRDGGNGGLYSLKAPSKFVSRKPGEWQTVEARIVGSRISVILNGEKIHDNVEITRATGGQLDNDLGTPGPIMLQGDHGAITFDYIHIKPLH